MTKAPVECIFGGPRIKESDVRDATHARHEPPGKRAERTCMATYNETTREAQEKFLLSTLHDDEPRARKVTSNGRCGRWVELGTEPVKKKNAFTFYLSSNFLFYFLEKYFLPSHPGGAPEPGARNFACGASIFCLLPAVRNTNYPLLPAPGTKGGLFLFVAVESRVT